MKFGTLCAFMSGFFLILFSTCVCDEYPFVIVIPTYNNERAVVEKNLRSVFEQEYDNYRVIIIDDCSPNQTTAWCREICERYGHQKRVTIFRNEERCGALANTYAAIHSCTDNEIWIVLDGDDWLAGPYALKTFNNYYHKYDALASFGQYVAWPTGEVGHAEPFPEEVIRTNSLRSYRLPSKRAFLPITAPRTGYAWLFKLIKLEDLLAEDGYFYLAAGDYAYMIPVLEMAAMRGIFIPAILYVYNINNPIADSRVNKNLQAHNALRILHAQPYEQVPEFVSVENFGPQDSATLIIFSDNNAAETITKLVAPVQHVIRINQLNKKNLARRIQDATTYLVLATENIFIDEKINLEKEIRALKKSHAKLFLNSVGHNQKKLFINQRLPTLNLEHDYFGCSCTNYKIDKPLPLLSLSLISKDLLFALLDDCGDIHSIEDLELKLSNACKNNKVLSLIGKKATVHTKDLRCRMK